jgi:bifunctional DNA-binding transcriptional regulator/antitoxin component of YhaV-PrlF toxin-antitoxin module
VTTQNVSGQSRTEKRLGRRPSSLEAARSNIVAKFQTTVPTMVRDRFDLREGDILEWTFNAKTGIVEVHPLRATAIPPQGEAVIRGSIKAYEAGRTQRITAEKLEDSLKVEEKG